MNEISHKLSIAFIIIAFLAGSFAFADPEAGLGYAYVTNRMGAKQGGDPRELALGQALRQAIGQPMAAHRP